MRYGPPANTWVKVWAFGPYPRYEVDEVWAGGPYLGKDMGLRPIPKVSRTFEVDEVWASAPTPPPPPTGAGSIYFSSCVCVCVFKIFLYRKSPMATFPLTGTTYY